MADKINHMNTIKIILSKIFNLNIGNIDKKYLRKIIPKASVIIEAGAHVGVDTIEIAKLFPEAKIFAFEPVPQLYKKLVTNTSSFENVSTYQLALSNNNGTTKMFISGGASDGSSSLLRPSGHLIDHPDVKFKKTINVKCTTLYDWTKKEKIEFIDFLWLDMQGYEMAVLQKSVKLLKNTKYIYTEVSLKEVYKDAPLYPELKSWLEKKGFVVIKELLIWDDMGNVLFMNKKLNRK